MEKKKIEIPIFFTRMLKLKNLNPRDPFILKFYKTIKLSPHLEIIYCLISWINICSIPFLSNFFFFSTVRKKRFGSLTLKSKDLKSKDSILWNCSEGEIWLPTQSLTFSDFGSKSTQLSLLNFFFWTKLGYRIICMNFLHLTTKNINA